MDVVHLQRWISRNVTGRLRFEPCVRIRTGYHGGPASQPSARFAAKLERNVSSDADTILLTIFLKHDQSKNLESIQAHLAATGWWDRFPPKGVEIVSWNVVMGIGQIVTLRLPPRLLNAVNVEIERCAWGAFTTEFFPSYDFIPARERLKREWRAGRARERAKT
jgi:hypothetical protein